MWYIHIEPYEVNFLSMICFQFIVLDLLSYSNDVRSFYQFNIFGVMIVSNYLVSLWFVCESVTMPAENYALSMAS